MDIVPRIGRPERRNLLHLARKSGDLATALRFLIVARLGLRKTSSEVASEPRFSVGQHDVVPESWPVI